MSISDNSSDLVSIIIPVFNAGKYFIRCIESCINQTYTNLEIILVDDCSTDPYTIELLNTYAAKDSRIRLLKSPKNSGQAYCRNIGIDACHGKYFAMIDNDDSFAITFIEHTHAAIVEHNTDLVITHIRNYPDDTISPESEHKIIPDKDCLDFDKSAIVNFKDYIANGELLNFPIPVYGKLFNTAKYRAANLRFDSRPQMRSVDDQPWFLQLQFALKDFYFLPIIGVFRLVRLNSDSKLRHDFIQRCFTSFEICYKILCEHNVIEQYKDIFINYYVLHRLFESIDLWNTREERLLQINQNIHILQRLDCGDYKRFDESYNGLKCDIWCNFYNKLFNPKRNIYLWWFALPSIYDDTDHNLLQVKHWLEALANMEHFVVAISTTLHKHDCKLRYFEQAVDFFNSQYNYHDETILKTINNGFTAINLKLNSTQANNLTTIDHCLLELFITKAHCLLELFITKALKESSKPRVIFVTGSDSCSLKAFALLKQTGFRLIYVATGYEKGFEQDSGVVPAPIYASPSNLNGFYTVPNTAQEVMDLFDGFVTFSAQIAKDWSSKFKQPIYNLGYLARPTMCRNLSKDAQYVTITSNAAEYGFAIFLRIVLLMSKVAPQVKFLVTTEAHLPIEQSFVDFHFADGSSVKEEVIKLTNLTVQQYPANLDPIYDKSLLMILPTITPRHSAEPTVNALVNGVPVITTNHGENMVIPNSVTYLPVPASTLQDPYCLPSEEEVAPYIEAITTVLAQDHTQNRQKALRAYNLNLAQRNWNKLLSGYL